MSNGGDRREARTIADTYAGTKSAFGKVVIHAVDLETALPISISKSCFHDTFDF